MTFHNFPRCITYRYTDCIQFKVDNIDIKKLLTEKVEVKRVNEFTTEVTPATAVNLWNHDIGMGEELQINYTYTDLGRQLMILDLGAPVSLARV